MEPLSQLQLRSRPITWRVALSHSTPSQLQQSLSSFQEPVFGYELKHILILVLTVPKDESVISKGVEAYLSRDRELLKWSRAEHGEFEEKEEEKEDGKSKESRQKKKKKKS